MPSSIAARLVGRTITQVVTDRREWTGLHPIESDTAEWLRDCLLVLDDGTVIANLDPLVIDFSEVEDAES